MSIRSVFLALAALVVAAPAALRAQDTDADFVKARKEFVAGQMRAAATTLVFSSLAVRQQVGRCRTEDVGTKLIDAESQLEKLAAAVRAGTMTGVKSLDQSLKQIDRVLAQHHLQLAMEVMGHARSTDIPVLARDIDRALFHYERSITLDGHQLAPEQAAVMANARTLIKEIEGSSAVPKSAKEVLTAVEKLVVETTATGTR